jgi:hypothetical protein
MLDQMYFGVTLELENRVKANLERDALANTKPN